MKKLLTLFFCLSFCFVSSAQNKKIKAAVVVNMDTVFTVLGPYGIRTFNVNLPKHLFGYMHEMIDTSAFELKEEVLPELIALDSKENMGFPKKSDRSKWLSEWRKSKGYDMVIFLFTAQIDHPTYRKLNGFSYGMTSSENLVFSLNDAYIWDTRDAEELAHVSLYAETEFVTRLEPADRFKKPLRDYTLDDIVLAQNLILNLNMNFALRACQHTMLAKRALDKKQ
jgi:hypothetical protein